MSDDFMLDTDDLERRMTGAMGNLRTEFASLRTGRASASMLEPVMVVAIGGMVGTIVIAMFLPMVAMIESLNGGGL